MRGRRFSTPLPPGSRCIAAIAITTLLKLCKGMFRAVAVAINVSMSE